jgi:hypothetical protein
MAQKIAIKNFKYYSEFSFDANDSYCYSDEHFASECFQLIVFDDSEGYDKIVTIVEAATKAKAVGWVRKAGYTVTRQELKSVTVIKDHHSYRNR